MKDASVSAVHISAKHRDDFRGNCGLPRRSRRCRLLDRVRIRAMAAGRHFQFCVDYLHPRPRKQRCDRARAESQQTREVRGPAFDTRRPPSPHLRRIRNLRRTGRLHELFVVFTHHHNTCSRPLGSFETEFEAETSPLSMPESFCTHVCGSWPLSRLHTELATFFSNLVFAQLPVQLQKTHAATIW
jgi:hypothetical protein